MIYDKLIKISVGNSRKTMQWPETQMYWSEFIQKLSRPERTAETFVEYKSYAKPQQDELKDVGGFVGGTLLN